jgi:1-acyl-sn-glycerol-3-phosphate acyltransferase
VSRFATGPGEALLERLRAPLHDALLRLVGGDVAGRLAEVRLTLGAGGVDPFGLDPEWAKYVLFFAALLRRRYFRADVFGIERVPEGRVLLVSNHSGQFPFDGAVLGATMFLDATPPRIVRAMVEKWVASLPFVSLFFSRMGQVVGVPANAKRLLEQGEALLVFPEGSRGISKPFEQRYRLTEFGLGFMRLAMETSAPIVPIAIVGAEEQYVSVANVEPLAALLGIPAFPIIPQLLFPGGLLPLPTKYRIYFGEPMTFDGDADDDDAVIEEKVRMVKQTIQSMLVAGVQARQHVFW